VNQQDLTEYNVGQNLDDLSNLDPRGYGVCRILYEGARKLAGEPLSMHAARQLKKLVKKDDVVVIMTGFVLLPNKKAETDGMISTMIFARALAKAFEARPLIVCPENCVEPIRRLAPVIGLHLYETIPELLEYPISVGVMPFTKDASKAGAEADAIAKAVKPACLVTIEAAGGNELGVYHNAVGKNLTELEAKSDVLFEKYQALGVPTISIGDLGNEMGMGSLYDHLEKYIPGAKPGTCVCGCGKGIAARTKADTILTATVSDWGCYAMIAALAFLLEKPDIMADEALVRDVIVEGSRAGLVDMWGWSIPAVDGCDCDMIAEIAGLMRRTVISALSLKQKSAPWFERVLPLGFYQERTKGA